MRTPESAIRRVALQTAVAGTVGIACAYLSAFGPPPVARSGPWLMAAAMPLCMIALMTLGAVRSGRRIGALAAPFALVFVLVAGGFLLALAMPADTAAGPYWLGLPPRAAVIVYGVGLLPLFVLPVAYALTFDALTLTDDDVARVRAARRAPDLRTDADARGPA